MGRLPRRDYPGAWHHVLNRGLAQRSIFEHVQDIRFFMSLLARMVRQGSLELHAYTILTNHFHLLLRSVEGQFSEAVGWIERRYVRYFNRSRNRDGPLFRGRFTSREVSSAGYWETLIRYIDQNAVIAGIVARSSDYPHCSAFRYSKANGPVWLERTLV